MILNTLRDPHIASMLIILAVLIGGSTGWIILIDESERSGGREIYIPASSVEAYRLDARLKFEASVSISMSGEEIYRNSYDPITNSFYRYIARQFFFAGSFPYLDLESGGGQWIALYIAIGRNNVTATPNDQNLVDEIDRKVARIGFIDNTTFSFYEVIATSAFTLQNSDTVGEVGLYLNVKGYWILVARDHLSTPIAVPSGETISVEYRIRIYYDVGSAFTEQLYNAILNYGLGIRLSGYGQPILFQSLNYGYYDSLKDYYTTTLVWIDLVSDYLVIYIGNGTSGTAPFNTVRLASLLYSSTPDSIVYNENATHIEIIYMRYYVFSEPVNITEVGIAINTDRDPLGRNAPDRFLIVYIPVPQGIYVPANDSFTLEVRVYIVKQ